MSPGEETQKVDEKLASLNDSDIALIRQLGLDPNAIEVVEVTEEVVSDDEVQAIISELQASAEKVRGL